MGDFISREAAIKEVVVNSVKHRADPDVTTDMIRGIEKLPAADVRPVVLCKDCRHRDPEDHKCDCGQLERAGCVFPVDDDYFCAYGEKREES